MWGERGGGGGGGGGGVGVVVPKVEMLLHWEGFFRNNN